MKYINLVLFAGMIVMNYLANALPLNKKTTGQLSDELPNLFVPSGITFSIWGVIYLLLAAYCVVQFTGKNQEVISDISWLFAVSCILNGLWIVTWHFQKLPLSLLVMAGLLITLIYINIMVQSLPSGIIKASFGIYLGWICIATIANVTALLVRYRWSGFGISGQMWAIILICVGTLIVSLTLYRLHNPFVGLSVIWAFLGIYLKRHADFRSIALTAIIAIVVVTAITILEFLGKKIGLPG
jgi:tryptophan-rich sensory protein